MFPLYFDSTYEELKQLEQDINVPEIPKDFDSTYEELKHDNKLYLSN